MKRIALFSVLALCFMLLAASHDSQVGSLNINACGPMRGDVHLVIRVVGTGINYDQPSNNCELDQKTGEYTLTFYVPTPIPRGGEAAEYCKHVGRE